MDTKGLPLFVMVTPAEIPDPLIHFTGRGNGERIGDGTGVECDVAVDPSTGPRSPPRVRTNAISVLAVAEHGTMFDPSAVFYMDKRVTGSRAADYVDITASPAVNIRQITKAKNSTVDDVIVVILDRPRHQTWPRRYGTPTPGSSSFRTATWPVPPAPPARATAWT
ncbi:fructose-1,6-bisphosphatase glpX [Streptomyces sp. TLI_55]|nr:fructose-1,6-bisphosphatase glpX [Streptomyces sp. TLI_55]